MERTVNLKLLHRWLAKHGGIGELAHKSNVSVFTIMKMKNRINPQAPRKRITQTLLAQAIGVSIDALFPTKEDEAS